MSLCPEQTDRHRPNEEPPCARRVPATCGRGGSSRSPGCHSPSRLHRSGTADGRGALPSPRLPGLGHSPFAPTPPPAGDFRLPYAPGAGARASPATGALCERSALRPAPGPPAKPSSGLADRPQSRFGHLMLSAAVRESPVPSRRRGGSRGARPSPLNPFPTPGWGRLAGAPGTRKAAVPRREAACAPVRRGARHHRLWALLGRARGATAGHWLLYLHGDGSTLLALGGGGDRPRGGERAVRGPECCRPAARRGLCKACQGTKSSAVGLCFQIHFKRHEVYN